MAHDFSINCLPAVLVLANESVAEPSEMNNEANPSGFARTRLVFSPGLAKLLRLFRYP